LGIRDAAVSVGFNASKGFRINIDGHHFTADQQQATGGKTFGQEVDATGIYTYSKSVSIRIGFSAFSPDDLMKARFGSDTAFWGVRHDGCKLLGARRAGQNKHPEFR